MILSIGFPYSQLKCGLLLKKKQKYFKSFAYHLHKHENKIKNIPIDCVKFSVHTLVVLSILCSNNLNCRSSCKYLFQGFKKENNLLACE